MSASQTGIINLALVEIGEQPLVSLLDDSRSAAVMQTLYDAAVEETLRQHPWNCAIKRQMLAQVADQPVWSGITGEAAYQLPTDCLRVLDVTGVNRWSVEGRMLVVFSGTFPWIVYVARMMDESQMDPLLRRAIAMNLAATAARSLKGSQEIQDAAFAKWREAMSEARYIDSKESRGDRMWPVENVIAHETGYMPPIGGGR